MSFRSLPRPDQETTSHTHGEPFKLKIPIYKERKFQYILDKVLVVSSLDGFVKSPSAALRLIFNHCGVLVSTPHS